ncbi:hypothetical protein WT97_02570 [Burkholderia sp. MSMB1459WGS]|uniref:Shedu immune nuclease family protein n=1 Tax=Burkholderia sp. MSMB1459WGS TaxID=1637970 RepID=UPI00075FAA9B|nr:Shedu immune nuclease family protein [Burkholderia sp. MSMB1459WGS]KWO42520.1 hypothetical protein WT97_02570 [Burkholderia sp. MSMB1459WGS]
MASETGSELNAPIEFDHRDVMEPRFRLEVAAAGDIPCRDLYLQTFARSESNSDVWVSLPESDWHLLARISPEKIVTYPVHTNPHAQRYLSPRHGRFATLVYQRVEDELLPDSADDAVALIESRQPWRVFNECIFGLGLKDELDTVWQSLAALPDVDIIVINDGITQVIDQAVWITEDDLDALRRAFDRAKRGQRERVKLAKKTHVRNALLSRLNPERFPPIVEVSSTGRLVQVRLDRMRPSIAVARSERRSTVRAVRANVELLAAEAPGELMALHAEIERVTLVNMIERYESMLQQSLPEGRWQRFFENNVFILTMLFARPVRLLHTQFHAQGSNLDGSGAQVGDFLLGGEGQSLAIVEIKRPTTALMLNAPYRNREVYGPSADLSGAVTQVLYQQSMLHSNWLVHRVSPVLQASRPDATKCVVIAGITPTDETQLRSFEIFRNACKNVEVVTFDELLGKLRLLLSHLSPQEAAPNPVPF